MKLIAIVIGMFSSQITFGQIDEENKTHSYNKNFLIGLNLSPDISYRTLRSNDSNNSSSYIDLFNKDEVPKLGFTSGLNFCYNFNKRFGIETGFQFSNKGYTYKSISPFKVVYNHFYIDIPIKVNFRFGTGKMHLISSLGFTPNIFIKATQTIIENKDGRMIRNTNEQQYNFEPLNLSTLISTGIEYRINNRYTVRIEPTFRYGMLKILENKPLTRYLWNVGLNLAYYYNINPK